MKQKFLFLSILIFTLAFISCGDMTTKSSGSSKTLLENNLKWEMIEDFSSYTLNEKFENHDQWWTLCDTDYGGAFGPNSGVVIGFTNFPQGKCLNLMMDTFGPVGDYGKDNVGFSYVCMDLHISTPGVLSFDYYHIGQDGPIGDYTPLYALDFYLNMPNNIKDDNNPYWSNTTASTVFSTHTVEIPEPGEYRIAWVVHKNKTGFEDVIYIDNIKFAPK